MDPIYSELLKWMAINLIFPLLAIGVIMFIHWASVKPLDIEGIIDDGQLCFYALGIVVAVDYDLQSIATSYNIYGVNVWAFLIGSISAVGYAIFVTDHEGAKQFSPSRVARCSALLALAAFAFACRAHYIILVTTGDAGHVK
jgi:hypothetical protein